MGCEETREALDAYALGALTPEEAKAVEAHVAGCDECRALLDEANQVASRLAFGVPLWRPSSQLRERILTSAHQWTEARAGGLRGRLARAALPMAAALLLAFAIGSAAWSYKLERDVNSLSDDVDRVRNQAAIAEARLLSADSNLASMTQQIVRTEQIINEQGAVFGTLTAPDVKTLQLWDTTRNEDGARGVYFWSPEYGTAGVTCTNLPGLPEGQVYHLWFFKDGKAHSGGTFSSRNGVGLHAVNLDDLGLKGPFTAYGVSVETAGAASLWPTSDLVLYAEN